MSAHAPTPLTSENATLWEHFTVKTTTGNGYGSQFTVAAECSVFSRQQSVAHDVQTRRVTVVQMTQLTSSSSSSSSSSPIWQHLLNKTQADRIEAIQRRAIRIIYSCTYGMPYMCALHIADIATLASRREQLARNFFYTVTKPCIVFFILPAACSTWSCIDITPQVSSKTSSPSLPY